MGLQPASVWNNNREEWCSDTSDDGGNCVCHDDGSLTCDPSGLGAQSAAPRECETPCTCQQLDPDTPDITETVRKTLPHSRPARAGTMKNEPLTSTRAFPKQGTCSAENKKCNVASDCGSPSCACETFITPGFGGEAGSFSTITKLCGLSSKIKARRALGEQVTCMCDDGTTASEACCGDLEET